MDVNTGHSVVGKPRVGIVIARSFAAGGIQTCCLELCAGLNRLGITPDILWDEPTDWAAFSTPTPRLRFAQGRLLVGSAELRSLPTWLMYRVRPLSYRFARLGLERYDFVYSFEPYARMTPRVPNLCYTVGPPFVRMPAERINLRRAFAASEIRKMVSRLSVPPLRPDPRARYVTLSSWIADLFLMTYGIRVPIIWPPVRTRKRGLVSSRKGFLFLSRLEEAKRARLLFSLARRFPTQRFTIAGATERPDGPYISSLAASIRSEALGNVRLVLNPADGEISQLFAEHEFFVFLAQWEHFGIVTVEAIQAGLIPFVHNSGGQREIVPIDALRFGNETELVEKATALLSAPHSERREMLEVLQKHVARSSPDNYCREMTLPLCRDLGLTTIESGAA
jgi:hypothetical protein